jgi:multiple antibiotic resistance protein
VRTTFLVAGETVAALFPVLNPVGNVPTFIALTGNLTPAERGREASKTAIAVGAILVVFTVIGDPLLHALGISLEALQIAGGIVVGYAGFAMTTATYIPPVAVGADSERIPVAFSPMAIPILAGPGSLGVLMGLEGRTASAAAFSGVLIGAVAMALVVYVCLAFGRVLAGWLRPAATDAINRVFGLIVLSIGVEMVVHGITSHKLLR